MRRVWDRTGEVITTRTIPKHATPSRIAEAELTLENHPEQRSATKALYDLYAVSGDLERAERLAERWSTKDPMDADALIARADLSARRGDRELAIRILGSVIDVRPGDVGATERLARLHRWQGNADLGCRFSVALAEMRPNDVRSLVRAVRCSRETGHAELGARLLTAVEEKIRRSSERELEESTPADGLSGDLRIEARWTEGTDIDLALLHPDGHRISWLGAPTKSIITATDVTSTAREGLALRNAKPGEYVIEVTRQHGSGPVSGTVTVTVAGTKRELPFRLDQERLALGVAAVKTSSRLVPAWGAVP
jgi:hypothetical protein